jgi:hypothetical protein
MKEMAGGKGGKVADQKQFTKDERSSARALRKEMSNVQGGFKKAFRKGSPQWKEAHIGEKDNGSTARLLLWAPDVTKAWEKYKPALIAVGRLVQADIDAMNAAAAVLASNDTSQETARNVETPEATAKKNQAKQAVITAADGIYTAIDRQFHNDSAALAKFAAIKELRFTPDVAGEGASPVQPSPDVKKSDSSSTESPKK